jgi:hypothetical protein
LGEGGELTHVQCKPIQNCHNECSLYNEYIQISKYGEKKMDHRYLNVKLKKM